jgi:hypothetical protein
MAAKSSIHIEAGSPGFFRHNDRSQPTNNSIFRDEKNEVSRSAKEAFQLYREELAKRTAAYTERTGQKLQKRTVTHLSAIVNLNQRHTLDDLQPLIEHLEKELDTKVFQAAIHRDEGHVAEDGTAKKNYHAHIEFMGIDSDGRSVRKKLTKKFLSNLQTKTAEILQMERGTNYARERAPRPRRLNTYEYKAAKKAEEKAVKKELAKQKELKEEMARLRAELKQAHAARAQYAAMEQANRELKEKVKARELTIEQLREQMAQMRAELLKQTEKAKQAAAEVAEKDKWIEEIAIPRLHEAEDRAEAAEERAEEAERMAEQTAIAAMSAPREAEERAEAAEARAMKAEARVKELEEFIERANHFIRRWAKKLKAATWEEIDQAINKLAPKAPKPTKKPTQNKTKGWGRGPGM